MANLNLNKVVLAGRIVKDPELKKAGDISVTGFTIAINRKTNKDDKITDFINCEAWRGTAEFICKYFHKGNSIAIAGEIRTDNYTDKDGNKRTKTFVNATEAFFVDAKGETSGEQFVAVDEDNLPF